MTMQGRMKIKMVPGIYLLTLLAILTTSPSAVASSHWTAAEVASTETDQHSRRVSMAVDDGGTVHLAWHDLTAYGGSGDDQDIFYRKKDSDGTWSPAAVVSTESSLDSSNPSIVVDGNGNVFVAWRENDLIVFKKRSSPGFWSSREIVSSPPSSASDETDLTLAVDSSGNVHVAWASIPWWPDYNGLHYRWRTAVGSWSAIMNINSGFSPCLMVAADSSVHWVYVEDNWAGIVRYRFKPNGGSWSNAETVSGGEFGIWHAFLAVGTDDVLHVVWDDHTGARGWGLLYSSKPVGGGWSVKEVVAPAPANPQYTIATTANDLVHVAWQSSSSPPVSRILCKTKGENGWSDAKNISTESTVTSAYPRMVADNRGILHAAWEDQADYNGSGQDFDIFYKMNPATAGTVGAELTCVPGSGTVPFLTNFKAVLSNNYALFKRHLAVRIDVDPGSGQHWGNWRVGDTQLDPGESYIRTWNQNIPALVTVIGTNTFSLIVEDVTPPPYNQPPYASSGDTDTAVCKVAAAAP